MRRLSLFALVAPFAIGCSASNADNADSNESNVDVSAENLWAGLTSATIDRAPRDKCNDGRHPLDNEPVVYEEYARQRADVRNICFEVWKPGVTDTDGVDFSKALDVQVHYRYKGESAFKTDFVPSIDRRGNNRRYAWALKQDLDALPGENIGDSKGQVEVVSETETTLNLRSELEFFFTINGKKLSSSTNANYRVAYEKTIRPTVPLKVAGPQVLTPQVTCTNLTGGFGPGFQAADITDQATIDAIVKSEYLQAASLGISGTGASRTLTVRFPEILNSPAGSLPHFHDGSFTGSLRAETVDVGSGKYELRVVVYDRTAKALKTITKTFSGCVLK